MGGGSSKSQTYESQVVDISQVEQQPSGKIKKATVKPVPTEVRVYDLESPELPGSVPERGTSSSSSMGLVSVNSATLKDAGTVADHELPAAPAAVPPITRSISSGRSLWAKLLDAEKKALEEDRELRKSAAALSTLILTDFARIRIEEPRGSRYGQEAARSSSRILKCLKIREKYVGAKACVHVEPRITGTILKGEARQKLTEALADIDGDCGLSMMGAENSKITWDPYLEKPPPLDASIGVVSELGVYHAVDKSTQERLDPASDVTVAEFSQDYVEVLRAMKDRGCASFCGPRLQELEIKYNLHVHRNGGRETQRQKEVNGRDFYQVRKVDTHIHHSAAFSQRQLMGFIKRKMQEEMDTPVMEDHGKVLTLKEVFTTAGIKDAEEVNAGSLCCMASIGSGQYDTFGRFDKFNTKYNPFGDKRMRDIFLKVDNYIEGRYLAELTKEVMGSLSQGKFIFVEWRISIYGQKLDEWKKLAHWFRTYKIHNPQVRWLIQVPRLYPLFKKMGAVENFAQMLKNIFEPLFQATIDPEGHEDIFYLLQQVVGFDSVDDESQGSSVTLTNYPAPEEWNNDTNPPYTYWMWHLYANIRSLNALRRHRGMRTFTFRPHCGEAGNVSHLCAGFMLTDGICHGVQLKESPVLQYLYYLAQIGLAVSPLSNDILFIPLADSPFGTFFRRGLNVSLSTDDPLIIHMTEEALIEEYVVAARAFRLSMCDLSEIARNSVVQSNFEGPFKHWWIGDYQAGLTGHDEKKTNVPKIRMEFRQNMLVEEMRMLTDAAKELQSN